MKICLISFDQWKYDHYIVETLQRLGIEAHHINISKFKYRYPTPLHRLWNVLNKVLFQKNIKKIKRQLNIIEQLKKLGRQDKILVINPEVISIHIHQQIKSYTDEYIAYLYDSIARNPAEHLLNGIFERIYSFDRADVAQYGFLPLSNYIYLAKKPIRPFSDFKYALFMILTIDKRLKTLEGIASQLDKKGIPYKFILVGSRKPKGLHPKIEFQRNRVHLVDLEKYLDESAMFLDLIRENQIGLSFRVFESLAFQKKLITTNSSITDYSFYHPDNILVISPDDPDITNSFIRSPYHALSEEIYNDYTLDTWVKKIFKL